MASALSCRRLALCLSQTLLAPELSLTQTRNQPHLSLTFPSTSSPQPITPVPIPERIWCQLESSVGSFRGTLGAVVMAVVCHGQGEGGLQTQQWCLSVPPPCSKPRDIPTVFQPELPCFSSHLLPGPAHGSKLPSESPRSRPEGGVGSRVC